MAGNFFQEYAVDSWATTEQSRLNWVKQNQTKIRQTHTRVLQMQLQLIQQQMGTTLVNASYFHPHSQAA